MPSAPKRFAAASVLLFAALVARAPSAFADLPSYGQWQADVHAAMAGGDAWLDQRAARGGAKLAIVLDIDNTSLETDYNPGKPTPEVLDFAKHARSLGFSVLFASYRTDGNSATRAVSSVGYPVDGMCPRYPGAQTAEQSKQACRKKFSEQDGYTITANVGNRPGDLTGGFYEKGFKLPDYDGQLQ